MLNFIQFHTGKDWLHYQVLENQLLVMANYLPEDTPNREEEIKRLLALAEEAKKIRIEQRELFFTLMFTPHQI